MNNINIKHKYPIRIIYLLHGNRGWNNDNNNNDNNNNDDNNNDDNNSDNDSKIISAIVNRGYVARKYNRVTHSTLIRIIKHVKRVNHNDKLKETRLIIDERIG